MTGCSEPAAPTGDALYRAGEARYTEFASGVHSVLMAVHPGVWAVEQGDYGAAPLTCSGDEDAYFFHVIRGVELPGEDPEVLAERARQAMEALDLEVSGGVYGSGTQAQPTIVGKNDDYRLVLTVYPTTGNVSLTGETECSPGSAYDLSNLVFDNTTADITWPLLPAFEGPDSRPQFFFPADGPVYYDEAGDPLDPQPVVTEYPEAPYGK